MARATQAGTDRWAARPALGAGLRLLALLGPIAVGLGMAVLVAAVLPEPRTALWTVAWWAAVLGGSAAAVLGTDRLARRLLPLAILLELSLIFPDKAPSRLRAARTSSVRDIDRRLARLRSAGVGMEPYEAAETVVTLVGILGLHDKRTRGHSERVRAFTDLLTCELGLDEQARVRLRWAALVHDLGKLTVPASVLNSAGKLDEAGWDLMHRHPDEGVRLLGGLLPWLGEWGHAVGEHHERYDGLGYPRGLAGEEISLAARIVSLADSFEVMTSARSYKTSRSAAWARGEITRCAGSQFDPALVRAFLGISLGRLRWVLGPVTWLAEVPFVATADRAGQTVKVASVTALAAGALSLGGGLPGADRPEPLPGGATVAAAEASATGESATDAAGGADGAPADALPPVLRTPRGATATGPSASATPQPRAQALSAGSGSPASTRPAAPRNRTGDQAGTGSTSPRRGPTGAPRPTPYALPTAFHLTPRGLQPQPLSRQETVALPVGSVRRFDGRIGGDVELPAHRDLVLFVRFPTKQGSAKLHARLLDCTSAGCTELSTGLVTQDKRTVERFQPYVVPLARPVPQQERLHAGHVLRLEVSVLEPGAKGPAQLAFGGSSTPSRLRLPEA